MLIDSEHELIKDIFYEACNIEETLQLEYLYKRCGDNREILEEVLSLIKSYKKSTIFFENLAENIIGVDLNEHESEEDLNPDPYKIIGSDINHYSILSKLGDGGMGVIYKAKDNFLNRIVALKFLPPFLNNDRQATKRFRREAITASNIDHTNVGTIYSVEETSLGHPFISMTYYEGETLENKLIKGKLPLKQSLNIIHQTIQGLEAAHQKNIVHRDIKPANIILLPSGVIKILDFGLAKVCDDQLTKSGIKMGTLAYMSPEHIRGKPLDVKSDIWSLGVLFYELLSGQRPFTGLSDESLMYSVLNDEIDFSRIDAPLSIKKIIQNCLQRKINRRYQSIKELSIDLDVIQIDQIKRSQSRWSRTLEKLLLVDKTKYLTTFLVLFFTISILTVYNYSALKQKSTTHYRLPLTKSIAIYTSQKNLSDFQLGLVNSISQTLLSIANNNENTWIVPYNKIKEYQAFDYRSARKTFGVNLIINLDLSYLDNRHFIQLELIDSKTLIPIKTIKVKQPSANLASLQESINTAILDVLDLSDKTSLRKNMSSFGTTDPVAFEAYAKALGLLQRNDQKQHIQQAISLLKSALQREHNFLAAKSKLAESYWLMYLESKNIEYAKKSEKLYEILILKQPDDISFYLSLGRLHTALGRFGTAQASYKLALQFNQNNAEIFEGMATIYEKTGELKSAEDYYFKSIFVRPDSWDGYNDLGAFYLRQGRYADAVTQFNQVVFLTPSNAWGYSNLGSAYWYLGQLDKTIENFEQSLAIREDYTLFKNLATLYFYENNFRKAATLYSKATTLNGKDHVLWANLAGAYHYAGRKNSLVISTFQKAIVLALEKLKVLPNDLEINLSLASYYTWTDQLELSRHYLAVIQEPSLLTVQHYFQIAVIYELLEDSKSAINWLEKALQKGYPKEILLKSPDLAELKKTASFERLISTY